MVIFFHKATFAQNSFFFQNKHGKFEIFLTSELFAYLDIRIHLEMKNYALIGRCYYIAKGSKIISFEGPKVAIF